MAAVRQFVHRRLVCLGGDLAPAAVVIRPYLTGADDASVAALAASIAAADDGPRLQPRGIVTELRGRAGRDVAAWLARPAADDDRERIDGLVTLVAARGRGTGTRWSIGWLLVHPAARRRGLGRTLVAAAVGRARERGAEAVWAETAADWPAAAFWLALGFELAVGKA